jgi:hypothetical protein
VQFSGVSSASPQRVSSGWTITAHVRAGVMRGRPAGSERRTLTGACRCGRQTDSTDVLQNPQDFRDAAALYAGLWASIARSSA